MAVVWSEDDISFLIANYPTQGRLFCVEALNRTVNAIRNKASALRLKLDHSSQFWKDWQKKAAITRIGLKRPSQSEFMKEQWSSKSAKEKRDMINKGLKTKEANGTSPCPRINCSWKAGRREIGGKNPFFRSRWEANYGRYLEWLKQRKEILEWEHEPVTFWFEGVRRGAVSYLPDFRVTYDNGQQEYHEVKGWMDARSKTKIKRMAKYWPDVKLIVIDRVGYRTLSKSMSSIIEHWEFGKDGL